MSWLKVARNSWHGECRNHWEVNYRTFKTLECKERDFDNWVRDFSPLLPGICENKLTEICSPRMTTNPIQASWPLKKPQQLIYVELGPQNGGMMLGICEQGLTLRAVAPLKIEGSVPFSFELDGNTRLQGHGEIAWTEDGGKIGGLKFTNVAPQFRDSVRAWLAGESTPKNVGREVTPAAALPLDSLEKIKAHVREYDSKIAEAKPAPPPMKAEPAVAKIPEAPIIPIREPEVPPLPEPQKAPLPVQTPLPVESPHDATFSLPKFRLPSAPPDSPAVEPPTSEPEPAPPQLTSVVTQQPLEKEYPPLEGLHQPYAHVPPESEDIDDAPQLNRAAAAAIIGVALAVILVALLVSFRREAGETLIRVGEKLAGETRSSVDNKQSVAPNSQTENPAPTAATQAPAGSAPSAPARGAAVLHIEDLPQPVDGGSGQKEFDQARNILKGSHRQRDIGQAINLLWIGVKKGYVPAEVTLADLYSRGDGVVQNCEQARVLLDAAMQKGSPEARRRLNLLPQQGCPAE